MSEKIKNFLKSMQKLLDMGELEKVFSYDNLVKYQILDEKSLQELNSIFTLIIIDVNPKEIFKNFTHISVGKSIEFPIELQNLKFKVKRLIGETMKEADLLITHHYKNELFDEDPNEILVSNATLNLKPSYPTMIITEISDKYGSNWAYYYYRNESINKNILFVPGLGWGYNKDKIIEIMQEEVN